MAFAATLPGASVVTSDEVLTEFLTYCAGNPLLRKAAGAAVLDLQRDPDIRILAQDHQSFQDGLRLYNARPDKAYSLTDCISMEAMRREGIVQVLTNDRHFEQEGFRAVFRQIL